MRKLKSKIWKIFSDFHFRNKNRQTKFALEVRRGNFPLNVTIVDCASTEYIDRTICLFFWCYLFEHFTLLMDKCGCIELKIWWGCRRLTRTIPEPRWGPGTIIPDSFQKRHIKNAKSRVRIGAHASFSRTLKSISGPSAAGRLAIALGFFRLGGNMLLPWVK